jgi:hypothetical protein
MMRSRFWAYSAAAVAALAVFCVTARPAAAQGGGPNQAAIDEAKKVPTPMTADGHPDLTGYWGGAGGFGGPLRGPSQVSADGKTVTVQLATPDVETKLEAGQTARREQAEAANMPPYKPELVTKVKALGADPVRNDPTLRCLPQGVPRMGAPTEIAQVPGAVILLYANHDVYRVVPTDGRPHDKDADSMSNGDAVGHWEGNTLVVDITNFNDDTWIGNPGYFHSADMHVTERFTREGNTLTYSVVVDDPNVLTKPWTPRPRTLLLGKSGMHAGEDYPCVEKDAPHLVNGDHH